MMRLQMLNLLRSIGRITRSLNTGLCIVLVLLFIGQQTRAADRSVDQTPKQAEPKISVPADGASVSMLEIGGRPVVEVRVNGQGPFRFILDTGATTTVVDSGLASQLSLPSSASGSSIAQLQVGDVTLRDLSVMAAPVAAMFGGSDAPQNVLSALAFPGYLLTFDYPAKRITLRKGELKPADGKTVFSYGADELLPTMPVKVAGHDVRVHLDTGAPFALALPTKYKTEVPLAGPLEEGRKAKAHAGEFPVFKGVAAGAIEIGDYKLASRDLFFTDVVPHAGAIPQGQLGYAALREFTVTLDFANRRIELSRRAPVQ